MGEWSPSHLIVAAIAVATIIGQLIIVLTRLKTVTERLEKRLDRQDETIRQQGLSFVQRLDKQERNDTATGFKFCSCVGTPRGADG